MKRGKFLLVLFFVFTLILLSKQFNLSLQDLKTEATYGTFSVSINIEGPAYTIAKNNFSGATTDFNSLTKSQQQNINSATIENTNKGKIIFIDNINISSNISLDDNINISFNRIELNSSNLPNFNKSATLSLYNLTFTNPRVLMNGIVCPNEICTENSYSNGIFSFNITHFTVYSSEESPTVETPGIVSSGGGGSGGGGGGITTGELIKDISITPSDLKIHLKVGETKKKDIIIKNLGTKKIKVDISGFKIEQFLRISENNFYLDIGESKTISLDFIAREDSIPELYIGKIIINGEGVSKEILTLVEIISKSSLMDVNLEIPPQYLEIASGSNLIADVTLYNFGERSRFDILLESSIRDENNNLILSRTETVALETKMNIMETFNIPKQTKPGKYILYIRTTYNGNTASSSSLFEVIEKPLINHENILYLLFVLVFVSMVILYFKMGGINRLHKKQIKIDEELLVKRGLIKSKKDK